MELYHYVEMVVADKVMTRTPAADQARAIQEGRKLIAAMFQESLGIAACYDFNYAAYWDVNDFGENVMISTACYREQKKTGTYALAY